MFPCHAREQLKEPKISTGAIGHWMMFGDGKDFHRALAPGTRHLAWERGISTWSRSVGETTFRWDLPVTNCPTANLRDGLRLAESPPKEKRRLTHDVRSEAFEAKPAGASTLPH
jgi:hypothetical protein